MVTGTMRRSVKAEVKVNGVRFHLPYLTRLSTTKAAREQKHVRQHTRTSRKGKQYTVRAHSRKFTMPQRQFVGDGKRTQEIIKGGNCG